MKGIAAVTQRHEHAIVGFAAFMSPADAGALLADPRIRRIEADLSSRSFSSFVDSGEEGYVIDSDLNGPWGLLRISDPDGLATRFNPCGAGVTVVIIDSGITPDHTEFGDRIVDMKNFNSSEADAIDGTGHGTHVAGTIAGRTAGVAPAADIAVLRVNDADGGSTTSVVIAALNWAASPFELPTPAVVNMSIGGTGLGFANSIYFDALQAVQNRGIPIVASAGNDAHPAQWSMPANSAATVCVGATGIRDRPAVFSNNGPTVDIWAPGVNVLACSGNQIPGSWLGDQYLDENGRSFWLNPLEYAPSVVTADLNCDHLEWDAPRTGTYLSPIDPRMGVSINPIDDTCIETDFAGSTGRIFFGHGTDCDQAGPTIDGASWCTSDSSSGDPANENGNPNWLHTLIRQPLPAAPRRIDRITTFGKISLGAPSKSNIAPTQFQQRSPAFTGDLRITVALDDGTTRSVIRSPEVGLAAFSKISKVFFYFSAEDIHEDDGRDVESICLTMSSPEPGLSVDRVLRLMISSLADDDPAPGAEYSPDNGRTWYPLLDSDERRLQAVWCIEGE